MTEIKTRIPTTNQILRAQQQQSAGEYVRARNMVLSVVGYPLDNYSRLSHQRQQRHLMAARIVTSSELSIAQEQLAAPRVAEHLSAARHVITTIYDAPAVRKTAHTINDDVLGNPYEFITEMARDKVAYMLIYAALTGNTEVIRQAMELMDKIIKNAKEPTMRSLVMFDKQRIKNQQELTYESFSSLTRAFQEATNTALDARNDGRAAVVSAQYIIDAEQRGDEDAITEGREVYEAATFDNDTLSDVLRREREFETKAQNRQRLWRATTPDGEDYSYLLLPTTY